VHLALVGQLLEQRAERLLDLGALLLVRVEVHREALLLEEDFLLLGDVGASQKRNQPAIWMTTKMMMNAPALKGHGQLPGCLKSRLRKSSTMLIWPPP